MFRPNYELSAAAAWFGGLAVLLASHPPLWPIPAVAALGMSVRRVWQAAMLYRFRLSISGFRIEILNLQSLLNRSYAMYQREMLYAGSGFKWQQRHTEIATEILRRSSDDIPGVPSWMPEAIENYLKPKDWVPVKDAAIGVPWIHGVEAEDETLGIPIGALEGHTLIAGTTRSGKTRFYEMVLSQLVYQGKTIIVVDPKGDQDLVKRLRKECQRKGRKFLYLHPAHPDASIRLNVLANWNSISDIATRLAQQVDANGSFQAFAWKTLYVIMRGELTMGRKSTIRSVKRYAQLGVEPLLVEVLTKWFLEHSGADWDAERKEHTDPKDPHMVYSMIRLYTKKAQILQTPVDESIDGLCAMVKHSKEHYSKMIQVLEPLLEMLGSDEIGKMLSPDPADIRDTRPIYDTRKIIEENAVLYVGLDSLSNTTIGSAIGSIVLADFASVCGAIYNFEQKADVHLLVDEASEALNDQLIQILNKGGGAGMKCWIATQTISDFVARMGSTDKAKMVLGNLNNVISLRIKDYETAEWIAKSFGKTGIRNQSESINVSSGSAAHPTEFSGGAGRSLSIVEAPLVSADLLTRLPPLNYFAFIAGTSVYKGRFPIIAD